MNRRISVPEGKAARRQGSIDGLEAPGDICREAITASPFGVLVHDAGGRILLFNARLEQITGYAAGEIPDIAAWIHRTTPTRNTAEFSWTSRAARRLRRSFASGRP